MTSKEKAEKRYKEGKCTSCGRVNDRLPLKTCSKCGEKDRKRGQSPQRKEYMKEYDKTPNRKEYKKEYMKEYLHEYRKTPEYKEYMKEYDKTPNRKEYKKEYMKEYRKTPEYKEYMKEYEKTPKRKAYRKKTKEKRVEEGRCRSCGRPLLMGETTKKCRMCSEKQFYFNWD